MFLGISWKPPLNRNGTIDDVNIRIMNGVEAVISRFESDA